MRIKEVSEQINLTIRTIRLYIEEKLISPQYSENYLGRRSYNFSHEDVTQLSDIATLRKFGFTISEIRRIIEVKDSSIQIIGNVCSRKMAKIQDESKTLCVLSLLNNGKSYSVGEIAKVLNSGKEKRAMSKDTAISKILRLLKSFLKTVLLVADNGLYFLALGFAVFGIIYFFAEWKYPHFSNVPFGLFCLFLTSIPTLIIISLYIWSKYITKKNIVGLGIACSFLLIVWLLPLTFVNLIRPVESFTTDMNNYRQIDKAYRNSFYNELFPLMPKGAVKKDGERVSQNSNYYYRCGAVFDYTTDIYAEWSLSEDEFEEELNRVNKLYSAYKIIDSDKANYEYAEIQQDNFTCLIRYSGETPFHQVEDDYDYFIFAYDEITMRVRYIVCSSGENGAEQPYYLQLDW